MIQAMAPVIENREVMPGTCLMWIESAEIALQSKPGQFVMVRCGAGTVLRRPLSVHRVTKEKAQVAFLLAIVGKGTEWLAARRAGEILDIIGPLGNGFAVIPGAKNLLMVAGGMGIAPLCFLADTVAQSGRKVTLLLGAATANRLYPAELLPPAVRLVVATEDGKAGYQGLVTDLIPLHVAGADQIFICGPMPMLHYIAAHRPELGLDGKHADVSLETRMGCGLGVCYGCTIRTVTGLRQVCQDGPVFPLGDVIWDDFTRC